MKTKSYDESQKSSLKNVFILVSIFSLLIASGCSKSDLGEKNKIAENKKTDEEWVSILAHDSNFIRNIELDKEIFELEAQNQYLNNDLSKKKNDLIIRDLFQAKQASDILSILQKYEIPDAKRLVELFTKKAEALQEVASQHSDLQTISRARLNNVISKSYYSGQRLIIGAASSGVNNYSNPKSSSSVASSLDPCSDAYNKASSSCDDNYTLATVGAVVTAGAATIVGTPLAGAGTLTVGVALAWGSHYICLRDAQAQYDACKRGGKLVVPKGDLPFPSDTTFRLINPSFDTASKIVGPTKPFTGGTPISKPSPIDTAKSIKQTNPFTKD